MYTAICFFFSYTSHTQVQVGWDGEGEGARNYIIMLLNSMPLKFIFIDVFFLYPVELARAQRRIGPELRVAYGGTGAIYVVWYAT